MTCIKKKTIMLAAVATAVALGAIVAPSAVDASADLLPPSLRMDSSNDTTPPTITILGYQNVIIGVNSTYVDAGATCTDDIDPSPVLTTYNSVYTNSTGFEYVQYDCTDATGNAVFEERLVVIVRDPSNTNVPAKDAKIAADLNASMTKNLELQSTIDTLDAIIDGLHNGSTASISDILKENKNLERNLERVKNIKDNKKQQISELEEQIDELELARAFIDTYYGNVTKNPYSAHYYGYTLLADIFETHRPQIAFDWFLNQTGLQVSDSRVMISLNGSDACTSIGVDDPCVAVNYARYTSGGNLHLEIYRQSANQHTGVVILAYDGYYESYQKEPGMIVTTETARDENAKKIKPTLIDRLNSQREYVLEAGEYAWYIRDHPHINGTITVHEAPVS